MSFSLDSLRTLVHEDSSYHNFLETLEKVLNSSDSLTSNQAHIYDIGAAAGVYPMMASDLSLNSPAGHVTVLVTSTSAQALELYDNLGSYIDLDLVEYFPGWDILPSELISPDIKVMAARLKVLRTLFEKNDQLKVIITDARGLVQPFASGLEKLKTFTLIQGQESDFEALSRFLAESSYDRVDLVTAPGEFAVRGDIIDIFPADLANPLRIDFFGDEIESIRPFSQATQRSDELVLLESVEVGPARELLVDHDSQERARSFIGAFSDNNSKKLEQLTQGIIPDAVEPLTPLVAESMTSLSEILPAGSHIVVIEPEQVRLRAAHLNKTNDEFYEASFSQLVGSQKTLERQAAEKLAQGRYRDYDLLLKDFTEKQGSSWWNFTSFSTGDDHEILTEDFLLSSGGTVDDDIVRVTIDSRVIGSIPREVQKNLETLLSQAIQSDTVLVCLSDVSGADRLVKNLLSVKTENTTFAPVSVLHVEKYPMKPEPYTIYILEATASEGFTFPDSRLNFWTEKDVYGRYSENSSSKKVKRQGPVLDPLTLEEGDYIVHDHHGIGRFVELVKRPTGGALTRGDKPMREYLIVEYAPSKRGAAPDRLYIPSDQLTQITRYVGGDQPTLSKMGGSDWAKTKGRVRKAVKQIAAELIKLYSARMSSRGHAFAADTSWQKELEDTFEFVETPDQLTTIDEVKNDMESEIPMDRLISGDVGYGKTEVALRAAFKAVQDGKQVSVLVPTTLLAKQHFETFTERYENFPINIKVLSRFQTAKEARQVKEGLKDGSVDIVIGTHRLLSSDIEFKDLGLVIIDEEQRFGVEHKERLKALRTNVDVLAMSATPIPRTLEMAVTGIREMSTLTTPPQDRQPVITHVGPYTDKQVIAAVRRELTRDGQVFYVHNRVADIDKTAAQVKELVPEARVAVAHGQMSESHLEKIIVDFWEKRFDVLVCTTIVETGLDISNANTLIVDDAQRYGLSQLHQLRGRVGRSSQRAYAYFLYDSTHPLGEVALDRLKAVATHNEFGAGMRLAMKDLEIRGAGNLLGAEQSGHIEGVGFDLYLRLVGEAVAEYKGEELQERTDVKLELPVSGYFPESYISGEKLRLQAYKNIADIKTVEDLEKIRAELIDRYGKLPQEVQNLLDIVDLKLLMVQAGLTEVAVQGNNMRFGPVNLPESALMKLERRYPHSYVKEFDPDALKTTSSKSIKSQLPTEIQKENEDFVFIPRPKTANVGGMDLVDQDILTWVRTAIKDVFLPAFENHIMTTDEA